MATSAAAPIACTLAPGDFKDRLAWIASLTRDALRTYQRHDLSLILSYAPDAADRVREMVRREQECCSFLTFDLREEPHEVRLTITSPDEAREAADMLFEQFVASAPTPGCGCDGQAQSPPPMSDNPPSVAGNQNTMKAAGVAAVTLATGAVACGACCVLPFALPAVALASTGTVLAMLANAHGWVTGLAVIAVTGAWIWVAWQSIRTSAKPALSTLCLMAIATALLTVAVLWPYIEPHLVRALVV
jgi:hypothetical protein